MPDPIPTLVQGLGPIGAKILLAAQAHPAFRLVGAVDVAGSIVGRDLAQVVSGATGGITVRDTLAEALDAAALPDSASPVLLHATGSYLDRVAPQLEQALRLRLHVVSTCEELAYPFARHPELSSRLHDTARSAERTLVGTGVNPGFVMDRLAVMLAQAAHSIRSVTVERVQNPKTRRVQFQRKVGMNLPRDEYDRLAESGAFGHVGLQESARLIAAALDWRIDDWRETLDPVPPDDPIGPVLGTRQTLSGATSDGRSVRFHFEAHAGVDADYDLIDVDGTPPLRLRIEGGVFGDDATAATILGAARVVPSAPRGLLTVLDLPLRPLPA